MRYEYNKLFLNVKGNFLFHEKIEEKPKENFKVLRKRK